MSSLERHHARWLMLILIVAVILRVGVVLLFPQTIVDLGNREKNDNFAREFLSSGVFGELAGPDAGVPSAYTRPAYAWFLIFLYSTLGRSTYSIGITQALVSSLNVLLAFLIARQLVGRPASLLAAGAMAIYPYPIWHDVHVVRTGLDAFFSLTSVLLLLRLAITRQLRYAAAAGATIVAATQTTNFLVGLIPLASLWLAFHWRSLRWATVVGLVMLATAGAAEAPWIARNYQLYGRIVPFSTDNGWAFYKNNNPYILGLVERNLGPDNVNKLLADTELHGLSEAEAEARYYQMGLAWIRQHPADKAKLMILNAVNYWHPLQIRPRSDTFFEGNESVSRLKNLAYAASFTPILLLGLTGLARRLTFDGRSWLIALTFAYSTALYAFTYGSTRYRIPLDGLLACFAAEAVVIAITWWVARASAHPSVSPAARRDSAASQGVA